MSETASEDSKQHLATFVMNHPALPAIKEDIRGNLFDRWLRGTPAEQQVLRDINDNMGLFFSEMAKLAAQAVDLNPESDDDGTT